MRKTTKVLQQFLPRDQRVVTNPGRFLTTWWSLSLLVGIAILAMPATSRADSATGNSAARANLDFRIVIPAIVRVAPVTQPDHIVVEDSHIAQGYVDLDAGTSVKLTSNSRDGFMLSASYDTQLLSRVEVRISNKNLTASSGFGSMRVAVGHIVDRLVPISYRLHLAAGARAGNYRWPVALAFSLASV